MKCQLVSKICQEGAYAFETHQQGARIDAWAASVCLLSMPLQRTPYRTAGSSVERDDQL
jgi:hypothetical protein